MQHRRDAADRGSATALMVGLMAVVALLAGAAMVVAGFLVAQHRARAAADLAALSAAAAYENGEPGCPVARQVARRNGARVLGCDRVGDDVDFVVTVRAAVDLGHRLPRLPRAVVAEAHAGPLR